MLLLDQITWLYASLLVGHILTTAGAALLIPAFETVSTSGHARIDRVVTGISLISYSLYLYNNMMADAMAHQFGMATSWPMLALMIGGYLLATSVVAVAIYHYVEAPVLRWRDRTYPEQLSDRPAV